MADRGSSGVDGFSSARCSAVRSSELTGGKLILTTLHFAPSSLTRDEPVGGPVWTLAGQPRTLALCLLAIHGQILVLPQRAPGRARQEHLPFARVSGERRGPLELGARLLEAAELREQIAAHARQQVVAAQRRLVDEPSTSSSPAAGPNAMPTATARFSSTTGDGVELGERVVERGDPLPVGLAGRCGRAAWQAAIAACSPYGPSGAAERSARVERRQAAADQEPVPARAVLLDQQDRLPRRARSRRASVTPAAPSARPGREPLVRGGAVRRGCDRAAAPPRSAPGGSSRRRRSPRSPR